MKAGRILNYDGIPLTPRTYSYLFVTKCLSVCTALMLCLLYVLGPFAALGALVSAFSGSTFAWRTITVQSEAKRTAIALLIFNLLVAASPLIPLGMLAFVAMTHRK
jgi:hypothetical protein